MIRSQVTAVLVLVFIAISVSDADARRGFRIPIPGLGGEQIQKVLDLPNIPALRRKDGKYVDLGYLHHRFFGGKWVGYIGSSSKYVDLSEKNLTLMLRIAGVRKLPPVPERPGRIILLVAILALIALFVAWNVFKRFAGRAVPASRSAEAVREHEDAEIAAPVPGTNRAGDDDAPSRYKDDAPSRYKEVRVAAQMPRRSRPPRRSALAGANLAIPSGSVGFGRRGG